MKWGRPNLSSNYFQRPKTRTIPIRSVSGHFSVTNLGGESASKPLLVPELLDGQVVVERDSVAEVRFRVNGRADSGSGFLEFFNEGSSNPGTGKEHIA